MPGPSAPGSTATGPQREAIEQEAARLFHMARDSGADEDWARVYNWIEQSPAHGVAFAKAEASWDMAVALRGGEQAHHALADLPEEISQDNTPAPAEAEGAPAAAPRMSRRNFALMAAGTGVAAVTGLALWQHLGGQRYATGVGEARLIRLADGSKVRLNTDSIIDVSLEGDERSVRFLKGEARFDVSHDPARPFLVTARDGAVQALGTIFNMRQRQDFTEVTVLRGQLAVIDQGVAAATIPAGAGAMMRSAAISVIHLAPGDLDRRTAWQQGQIHLQGETLAQAVDEFNRYRRRPLVIGDPDLASLRMGGMFSAAHSDDFVEALKASFGIRVMEGNDGAVILLPENDKPRGDQASA